MVEENLALKEIIAYVIDLGSGIAVGDENSTREVREWSAMFAALEVNDKNSKVKPDFKSDVWSLGCVLYFMVTE